MFWVFMALVIATIALQSVSRLPRHQKTRKRPEPEPPAARRSLLMTVSNQNPYEPPQAASAIVTTALAPIAKERPWRIWKWLCLLGLVLALPSFAIVEVFDSMDRQMVRQNE